MSGTLIGVNSPLAVKLFSADLHIDITRKGYFTRKFMGRGDNLPLQIKTELEQDAGDEIKYDLSVAIGGDLVEGDDRRAGSETDLKFYQDSVKIDQAYKGVSAGGVMSRKRTLHNLRTIAKQRLTEYWSRVFDELIFMYLSGARGVNADYTFGTGYTGRAGNAFTAPDSAHIMYGDGSSKATLTSAGTMTRAVIERVCTKADTMGGGTLADGTVSIQPCQVEGNERRVLLMHTFQEHSLRTSTAAGDWLDIQKAAAGAEGRSNPIFNESMGMLRDTILHSHRGVIGFSDYGSGINLAARRALLLGRQAGVLAFGSTGSGMRYKWHEAMDDRDNELIVGTTCIFGLKKATFNSKDFGVIAVDTYAVDPG